MIFEIILFVIAYLLMFGVVFAIMGPIIRLIEENDE